MTITIPSVHIGLGWWILPFILTLIWAGFAVKINRSSQAPSSFMDFGLGQLVSGFMILIGLVPVLISWIVWLIFR